jgi:hypothetical protein
MDHILEVRSNIYDQFHGSNAGQEHFFKDAHAEAYAAYYTAMYLIQDTGESVLSHMERGFSSDPWLAYIEFWGVMQAIVIQQDAIKELYEAVIGSKLQIAKESDWSKIRDVRNLCAGNPAKRANGVPATQRAFMGRHFGHYNQIQYELWDGRAPNQPSHPAFNLSAMIKSYDAEGAQTLNTVLCALATKWPKAVSPVHTRRSNHMHSIGEVLKQFEFHVPPLPHVIKGKIVKYLTGDGKAQYVWSISHHYSGVSGAGVYFPSRVTSPSLEEAEEDFRAYAESFVPDYQVKSNEGF